MPKGDRTTRGHFQNDFAEALSHRQAEAVWYGTIDHGQSRPREAHPRGGPVHPCRTVSKNTIGGDARIYGTFVGVWILALYVPRSQPPILRRIGAFHGLRRVPMRNGMRNNPMAQSHKSFYYAL